MPVHSNAALTVNKLFRKTRLKANSGHRQRLNDEHTDRPGKHNARVTHGNWPAQAITCPCQTMR